MYVCNGLAMATPPGPESCAAQCSIAACGLAKTCSSLPSTDPSLVSPKVEERGGSTNGILDYGREHQIRVVSAARVDNRYVVDDSQKGRAKSGPAGVVQGFIVAHGGLLAVRYAHRPLVWLWHAAQRRQEVQGCDVCCLV